MTAADSTSFTHLINLADGQLGAKTIDCSDDFFAAAENLVKPGRGEFDPDAYYDRGKVMDGWESRRKRGPGHDWCVLKLVRAGVRVVSFAVSQDNLEDIYMQISAHETS